jgi:universal stress protein A
MGELMRIKPAKQPGHVMVEMDGRDSERLAESVIPAALFKLKKILVPVDFSACSKKALQYAILFAKEFQATIVFVHVIPLHYAAGKEFDLVDYEPMVEGDLRKNAEQRLAGLAQEIIPDGTLVQIEVRHGVEALEIVAAARMLATDLIIISTHGRTGRAHAFIGSVAEDVVRLAPCPVLVVRKREHEFIREPAGSNSFSSIAT